MINFWLDILLYIYLNHLICSIINRFYVYYVIFYICSKYFQKKKQNLWCIIFCWIGAAYQKIRTSKQTLPICKQVPIISFSVSMICLNCCSVCSSTTSVTTTSTTSRHDPEQLRSEVTQARGRVAQLRKELRQARAEVASARRGVDTLAE